MMSLSKPKKNPSLHRLEKLIRKYLEEKGKSLTEFAQDLGVSRVTIYNLFRGKYSRKLLQKMSKTLSIPTYVLVAASTDNAGTFDEELIQAYHTSSTKIKQIVMSLLETRPSPHKTPKKGKIVVVDDVPDNVELLVRCLHKEFEVLKFTDPELALKAAKDPEVVAIITDQRMPTMTGTDLLMEINSLGRPIAKMIVSGYSDNEALLEAINKSKVDAFLMKPIKPNEVRHQLHLILEDTPSQIIH